MCRCGAIVPQRGNISRVRVYPPPRHGRAHPLPYLWEEFNFIFIYTCSFIFIIMFYLIYFMFLFTGHNVLSTATGAAVGWRDLAGGYRLDGWRDPGADS
jgi:hypothetical protein